MVTQRLVLPPINSDDPLNISSRWEVTWQMKNIISLLSQCLWPQDLLGVVTYSKEIPRINSHDASMRCSCEVTWQIKYLHLHSKLGKVLTYSERLPILKATWPFDPVTNVRSRDNLKQLYFYYHKIYGH